MCGIGGIFNYKSKESVSSEMLELISMAISHRGPDGAGSYTSSDKSLGLVHRRLAIIHPGPKADQPFSVNSNALTYNGALYNMPYLKTFIEENKLTTNSDTELLFHLMQQYGVDVLSLIDGMFAFGYWDNEHKALYLVRDYIGVKPLYYYDNGESIIFSSEIKGILSQNGISKDIDIAAIDQYLSFGFIQTPNTGFQKIKQLMPGHYLKIDKSGVVLKKFVSMEITPQKSDDPLHDFKINLSKAVKDQLISDVPITSFLSGGIDSSCMAIELNKIKKNQVFTNYSFDNHKFDESSRAEIISKKIGMNINVIQSEKKTTLNDLKKIAFFADDLISDPSLIPTYFLCRETAKKFKVSFSSDGGDELYHGYHTHLASNIALCFPNYILSLISVVTKIFSVFIPNMGGRYPAKELLQRFAENLNHSYQLRHLSWRRIFNKKQKLALYTKKLKPFNKNDNYINKPVENSISEFELKTYLESNLLKKIDRMSMAHGLEVRVPMLAKEFTAFSLGLDQKHKMKGLKAKVLPKRYLKQELGEEINFNSKAGFSADLNSILTPSLLNEFIGETKSSHTLFEFIDYNAFMKLIQNDKTINESRYCIYSIMNFKFWLDRFYLAV